MTIAPRGDNPGSWIGPRANKLLGAPIDFLLAEHARQRQAAAILFRIAAGVVDRQAVSFLIEFIEIDLAGHAVDEEASFFPVVRANCSPEDNIDALLSLLGDDHRKHEQVSDESVRILRGLLQGLTLGEGDRKTLRGLADRLRRHTALADGVLLPIARARLGAEALRIVSRSMTDRRLKRGL